MTQPSLDTFFSGGGKAFSWKDKPIGTSISGTVRAVHQPQQVTDPADGKLQFNKRGEPKMQVRIDLATNERDPEDPEDDGNRSLYTGGWLAGAIGQAIQRAGKQGPPEVGAHLTATLSERAPNDNPALNPVNKFTALYVPPDAVTAGQFFSGGASTPAANGGSSAPVKPAGIDQAMWDKMDPSTKAAVAATMSVMPSQSTEPPF